MTGTNQSSDHGQAVVVGAGIIGTCCALYLQRGGMAVTLIDRDGPGEGCSSGNAGNLGTGSCVPASLPGTVRKVPAMLLDPMHPLSIRWRHLPAALPWFVRFARAGRPDRIEAIADALHSLQSNLFDAYAPLIADAGADQLIRRDGKLFVYESRAAFDGDSLGVGLRRGRGIELKDLDGDDVRRMEPTLGPNVACGRFQQGTGHTVDPLRLVRALAASFAANGGTVLRERVAGFELDGGAVRGVVTNVGVRCAPVVDGYDTMFFEDPQAIANELIAEHRHPNLGRLRLSSGLIRFPGSRHPVRRPTPLLGEHTAEVLRESGYTESAIAELYEKGVVTTEEPEA